MIDKHSSSSVSLFHSLDLAALSHCHYVKKEIQFSSDDPEGLTWTYKYSF